MTQEHTNNEHSGSEHQRRGATSPDATDGGSPPKDITAALVEREALISRVLDGEASGADWLLFRELAAGDPAIWRELSDARASWESLAEAVDAAVGPVAEGPRAVVLPQPPPPRVTVLGPRALRQWGGWAAAALMALAWVGANTVASSPAEGTPDSLIAGRADDPATNGGLPRPGDAAKQMTAGVPGAGLLDADAAWRRYLEAGNETGRVVGELPQQRVVSTRPLLGSDDVEVLYVRQVLERVVVPQNQAFTVQIGDDGTPVRVPIDLLNERPL